MSVRIAPISVLCTKSCETSFATIGYFNLTEPISSSAVTVYWLGYCSPRELKIVLASNSSIVPDFALEISFTVVDDNFWLTVGTGEWLLINNETQSAQLSTVLKVGTPPASSFCMEDTACGSGKAKTGAALELASSTASIIGFTARSGLNCAEDPIATNRTPVSSCSMISLITVFMISYFAPARVTSTSLPVPIGMLLAESAERTVSGQVAISTPLTASWSITIAPPPPVVDTTVTFFWRFWNRLLKANTAGASNIASNWLTCEIPIDLK